VEADKKGIELTNHLCGRKKAAPHSTIVRLHDMKSPIADIHDFEVSNLVNKLIRFLGRKEIERSLDKYHASLQCSGPVFREYYLKYRHPWWNGLSEFFKIEKSGKSIRKNLTQGIKILAGDAKKITTLQRFMPEAIKAKYKRDLIDDERAYDYLFELQIAWHFFLKGFSIKWHEDNFKRHSEFLITTPEIEFNVECKRISVDASRKIRRRDFYRLADKVIPEIEASGYFGVVDLTIDDRLHGNENYLNNLSNQILNEISQNRVTGDFKISQGSLHLDLKPTLGMPVDIYDCFRKMWERKPHQAHGAIFARSKSNKPVDPVELTLKCNKSDNVLYGIRDRISQASKLQLDKSKPGFIACYLEGIDDLTEVATDSGLQLMSSLLLEKESFAHIAAISYSAETRIEESGMAERFYNQGLIYRNPTCMFEEARDIPFLSQVEKKFQYRLSDILPNRTSR